MTEDVPLLLIAPVALVFAACGSGEHGPDPIEFSVMTFNAGTTTGLAHDSGDDAYTSEHAMITDELYENSLSWNPAEVALSEFLARERPTVMVFQELYYDGWCETISVDPLLDFVCQSYAPERPLQIERLVGSDYQVACAEGQEDNCAAVLKSFASIRGCDPDTPCMGGLGGMGPPDGCSNGARVSSAILDLRDGRELTLVNVHGTSGVEEADMDCRVSQFSQIFVDEGDGEPVASGDVNLVMGDLNTDPFIAAGRDPSADFWNDYVGEGLGFHYISSSGDDGPRTYQGAFRIDHVVSDSITGDCVVPGERGEVPVMESVYWDHAPVLCNVSL